MLNTININLKTDISTDRPTSLPITLMSQDKNNNKFILRFTNGGEQVVLDDTYTVEVLTKFAKSGTSRLTTASVTPLPFKDNQDYATWEFDTSFITRYEEVRNYVYVRKSGNLVVSADANCFVFNVGLSEVDKGAGRVAETYDENYQKYLDEFKDNVDLEKIAQAETERIQAEQARKEAETDRVSAESVRVANEEERISKDSERDSKIEAVEEAVEVAVTNLFPDNEVLITGYSHSAQVDLTLIKNHKYYTKRVCTNLKGVTNGISGSVRLVNPMVELIKGLDYTPNHVGGVMDYSDETRTSNIRLYGPFSADSEGNHEAHFNDLIIIDLTEAFGVGNEPTAEQMDRLLEQFPNSWFDGTVNVYDSKHMMAMFFKELTKLNNAITTLGGNV